MILMPNGSTSLRSVSDSPSTANFLFERPWDLAGSGLSAFETRPLYQELDAAGLMEPLHTFVLGPNSAYRLTDAGCDLREGLNGHASHVPSGE